ncbi:MAG: deoxyribodipyrimidine photo-lyase [Candidatus Eremiobacterota bacterium]
MNKKRVRLIKEGHENKNAVIYWMSREQRVGNNWPLLFAQSLAIEHKSPLYVVFCLVPDFLHAMSRAYIFMLEGLMEVEKILLKKNIPFYLLSGKPEEKIPDFIRDFNGGTLVTDFDPLKIKKEWKKSVSLKINIPFYEVDGRNIVPCWIASVKREFGAYTIRSKIYRALPEFLDEFPEVEKHSFPGDIIKNDWNFIMKKFHVYGSVNKFYRSGEKGAEKLFNHFLSEKLPRYSEDRNDPAKDGLSGMSPYLHFGQISSQKMAIELYRNASDLKSSGSFLEELIVRRELSDNFCFYTDHYDSFEAFPGWARKTLNDHRNDRRDYIYSREEFESGNTHDELWNAAQIEMIERGKMHGYMRMYWAKKILEWSGSPEEALETAIYLNDKYELDGRDTNGYTGIAWAIGGLHDRAWGERDIFGKIRYMSYKGCKSKFNVKAYTSLYISS